MLNSSTADGTTTSLTEHLVSARLTETLVATWHLRDACVTPWTPAIIIGVHGHAQPRGRPRNSRR